MFHKICLSLALLLAGHLAADLISIKEMSEEVLMASMEGKNPNLAIKLSSGDRFPLEILIESPYLAVENGEAGYLCVKKDLYLKIPQKELYLLSDDGVNWKSWDKFITGYFNAGISKSEGDEAKATLSLGFDKRP